LDVVAVLDPDLATASTRIPPLVKIVVWDIEPARKLAFTAARGRTGQLSLHILVRLVMEVVMKIGHASILLARLATTAVLEQRRCLVK